MKQFIDSFINIPVLCNEIFWLLWTKEKDSNSCLTDIPRSERRGEFVIDNKSNRKAPIKKFNKIPHSSLLLIEIINLVEEVFQNCDAWSTDPSSRSRVLRDQPTAERSQINQNGRTKEYSLLSSSFVSMTNFKRLSEKSVCPTVKLSFRRY